MLDLYFLPPKQTRPECPEDLAMAMQLDLEHFHLLDELWIALQNKGLEISYFRDSYIPCEKMIEVDEVLKQLQSDVNNQSRVQVADVLAKLREVVSTAICGGMGLCGYCD